VWWFPRPLPCLWEQLPTPSAFCCGYRNVCVTQVGLTSPGNIGADVCHLNLHKFVLLAAAPQLVSPPLTSCNSNLFEQDILYPARRRRPRRRRHRCGQASHTAFAQQPARLCGAASLSLLPPDLCWYACTRGQLIGDFINRGLLCLASVGRTKIDRRHFGGPLRQQCHSAYPLRLYQAHGCPGTTQGHRGALPLASC
jgi:hypothetical protein